MVYTSFDLFIGFSTTFKNLEYWPWPRPGASSDLLCFPDSSRRKALELEASNGLVCNLKQKMHSEASIILDFCIMHPRILMEF